MVRGYDPVCYFVFVLAVHIDGARHFLFYGVLLIKLIVSFVLCRVLFVSPSLAFLLMFARVLYFCTLRLVWLLFLCGFAFFLSHSFFIIYFVTVRL